ncbi:MAG: glyoxalase/bleomycin resistance/dioxygenase family protein [Actinomycetota bacterium]
MQRMHVGMKVSDIGDAVAFYSRLFGRAPALERDDYAKWMLDDPFLNFSIDIHGDGAPGTAHFGLQQCDDDALAHRRAALDSAGLARDDQDDLICGYQRQHKSWVFGPDGEAWELFFTEGVVEGAGYGCEDMPDGCGG